MEGVYMWEFCLSSTKMEVARFIYQSLKEEAEELNLVLTCFEQFDTFNIVVACPEEDKGRLSIILERYIIKIVCSFFKENFLDQNLHLPTHEKISQTAFKKALINFDKETDFYIISKNLELKKNLHIESFYNFKLSALREKWKELVTLANDNSDYLIGDDAFFDLLKFLIDNLEVSESEITIFEKENGFKVLAKENVEINSDSLSKEGLISTLIDLSPKKINLYCEEETPLVSFLSKIFDDRINVNYNRTLEKIENFPH